MNRFVAFCGNFVPFTRDGLSTLIYLAFAIAGPVLTGLTIWAMLELKAAGQWRWFAALADRNSWALLIIICCLAMFISVRTIRLGPFEASGGPQQDQGKPGDPPAAN